MTEEQAVDILHKHEMLFNIAELNQSIPDQSTQAIQEINQAYLFFNPSFYLDSCCGACVFGMIKAADQIRKSKPKYYNFPKH